MLSQLRPLCCMLLPLGFARIRFHGFLAQAYGTVVKAAWCAQLCYSLYVVAQKVARRYYHNRDTDRDLVECSSWIGHAGGSRGNVSIVLCGPWYFPQ